MKVLLICLNVKTPISKARSSFWAGKSAELSGKILMLLNSGTLGLQHFPLPFMGN